MYLGDFRIAKTVRFMWNTNAVAGESITRATNGTVSVYKDGGTTQSTTGVTDTEDFDTLTGVHSCVIDTSADGTFYSAGSDFAVVLSGATIDGKSINAVLAHFSLEARSALMPTTDGRKLDVSAGGEAGVDWANVGSPTTTLNLSATTIKTATDVETDTADIQSRLPAVLTAGGNIKATLADGETHGGTTAMLRLGSSTATPALYVTSSGGNAFQLESTGGNGHAAYMLGNGTGEGIHSQGGASGDGIRGEAGATTGYGIVGVGNANGTHGIAGFGNGSGAGLYAQGGTAGAGGWFKGGSVQGPGVLMAATAGDDDGLRCEANGTGQDIDADFSSNTFPSMTLAANSVTAAALAADAVTEIQSGLATAAALTVVDDFLDTEIAAIKAKTDSLTFTVAGQVDANIQYVNDVQVNGVGTAGNPWGP